MITDIVIGWGALSLVSLAWLAWEAHKAPEIETEDEWEGYRFDERTQANKASCVVCGVMKHPANMVPVGDGEHQCQECRWGL